MTDREIVVNRLKRLIKAAHNDMSDFVFVTVGTANVIVRLLEEQERIRLFVDENGKITPLNTPTIVRCKDCKHGKIHGIDVECVAHEEVSYDPEPWHPLDWFCADGERRDSE